MTTVLVVLRGGPFDGRQLTVPDWPEPLTVESLPEDLHVEARVRARYLAVADLPPDSGPRVMVWDGAHRIGGIHHA
ncbi:hypothetical protein KRR55_03970 [Paeniglutamicibacter sp. ABSL32-1]|uniref:hypothetical protein n=1 Tax=Paeniglutamicibacter quisquiliarum TaxID=2849498 RepID=UPI001C2CED35|nr:hypothetical protein [Paeniglutamicibacter quisquiliarum]MBV1778273.1 hypothetical protein [Paeniglutamicibacter quisquiliarum]